MTGASDDFARSLAAYGDNEQLHEILRDLCTATQMAFAAVARVTDRRWIAVQLLDRIEFGLDPGGELDISTTICTEVRECGRAVVIDDVAGHPDWCTHPAAMLYGFKSYLSFPLCLPDGRFWGTLCAIDPARRTISLPETIAAVHGCVDRVEALIAAFPPPVD